MLLRQLMQYLNILECLKEFFTGLISKQNYKQLQHFFLHLNRTYLGLIDLMQRLEFYNFFYYITYFNHYICKRDFLRYL